MFPTASLHVALSVCTPSPLEVLLGGQLLASRPAPPGLSVQFQVTVTSDLFQPALAAGDWVALAVGARVSTSQVKLASVPWLPAGSLACTVKVCAPLATLG